MKRSLSTCYATEEPMITTFSHLPHPLLASFVRGYRMRRTGRGDPHVRVPVMARPQVEMCFHFTPPSIVFEPRSARKVDTPSPGPVIDKRTQRNFDLLPSGGPPGILCFQIS